MDSPKTLRFKFRTTQSCHWIYRSSRICILWLCSCSKNLAQWARKLKLQWNLSWRAFLCTLYRDPRTGLLRTFSEPDWVLRSPLRVLCIQGALSCVTVLAIWASELEKHFAICCITSPFTMKMVSPPSRALTMMKARTKPPSTLRMQHGWMSYNPRLADILKTQYALWIYYYPKDPSVLK